MNKNDFILWGSSGHAKVLNDLISINEGRVVALVDNDPQAISCLANTPLYYGYDGLQACLKMLKSDSKLLAAIAIGGDRGNDRQEIATHLKSLDFLLPPLIHPSAIVAKSSIVGEGCQVLANVVIAAGVSIGSVCIVNNSANVDHECVLGDGVHIAPGAVLCGCVVIGDNSMVGAGAVILPRINVGKNAVIGAGAVVTADVPDNSVVVGNPAKLIHRRKS